MKKLLLFVFTAVTLSAKSQSPNDSVKITLSIQARDLEFIASYLFEKTETEELYDSTKASFRGGKAASAPTGNNTVNVTGYAKDWFYVYEELIQNVLAYSSGCKTRLEALLTNAGSSKQFILDKLNALSAYLDNSYQMARQQGRAKLKRSTK